MVRVKINSQPFFFTSLNFNMVPIFVFMKPIFYTSPLLHLILLCIHFSNFSFVSLSRLIDNFISPSYELIRREHLRNCGVSSSSSFDGAQLAERSTQRPPLDLSIDFFQMLACAGPYLHRDTVLLQKVFAICYAYHICLAVFSS